MDQEGKTLAVAGVEETDRWRGLVLFRPYPLYASERSLIPG